MANAQTRTITVNGQDVTLHNYTFQMTNGFITTVWATNQFEAARIARGEQDSYPL